MHCITLQRVAMLPNNGGGMSFGIDDWNAFRRFLILGSESSCYQPAVTTQSLTCSCIERLIHDGKGQDMLQEILDISNDGRAPKQSYALYALAKIAELSPELKRKIFSADYLSKVCRTFSTLTEFLQCFEKVSWGNNTRSGIEKWMYQFPARHLAFQFTKYRNRNGYTPKDILRLVHPKSEDESYQELFAYVADKWENAAASDIHDYLEAADTLRKTEDLDIALEMINEHRFGWEHIGKQKLLKEASIWNTFLIDGMPYHAMLRNIVRMLNLPSLNRSVLCESIVNKNAIQHSRVHPIQILQAYRMVKNCGMAEDVAEFLDLAFDTSFDNVKPTHQRFMLALDVSGSMDCSKCVGMKTLTARDAAAAIALAFVRREPYVTTVAFSCDLTPLTIGKEDSLQKVIRTMSQLPFSSTDCSLPILYALDKKQVVDCFVMITDNETNCNREDPHTVLERYRKEVNPNAKMVVLATASTNVSIANPSDAGMLDIAGMDSSVFQIIQQFCLGSI